MLYHLFPANSKAGTLLLFFLFLFVWNAKAGTPENIPQPDITVELNNIRSLGDYVLHIKNNETDIVVYSDTLYTINAGKNLSRRIEVFAELNGVVTESIFFDESPQSNYVVDFKGITGKSLLYDLKQTPVAGYNKTVATRHSVNEKLTQFWKTNELLIGVSFVVLVGLIIYFVWRKKKKGLGNIDAAL